jgi:hypothetical protein
MMESDRSFSNSKRLWRAAGIVLLLASGACSNPNQTALRPPRQGAQRDGAGRTYFEFREISASFCAQEGFDEARVERGARDRLTARAQEMGYSGVREVACTTGTPECATGKTCRGISLRYAIPRADGSTPDPQRGPCEPACEGTATCQDGQCVAQCSPPCSAGRVCVQDGTCVQID